MSTLTITIPILHHKQAEVKQAAGRYNVVDCGRRWGKNVLGHELVTDTLLSGHPVAWGSPTYKNLADDWRILNDILAPIVAPNGRSEQDRRLETITHGVLEMWSLDNPAPIRGRAYKRFIFNEAAAVSSLLDTWNLIVRPTLIDMQGDAWFFSTPAGRNGFYQLHLLGMDRLANPDWRSWVYTSYENPYISAEELDEMRSTMTERAYRQEILAEFLDNEGQVFRNVDACMHAPVTGPGKHKEHVIVAGVDWGKQNDFTAISVGCATCRTEVAIDRFNQVDYAFQRQRLAVLLHEWRVGHTVAELNAMGEPIVEQLQRDGMRVTGFQTTSISKVALIESLALALEKGDVQFLGDKVWRAELEAYERSVTKTGLATYSAPEGMHDDTVIARALMLKAMGSAPMVRKTARDPTWDKLQKLL